MDRRRQTSETYDILPILYAYGMEREPIGRRAWCPFHADSTPSASVDLDKQLFYCHVCGIGGDAITLIRERSGADYPTALAKAQELSQGMPQPVRRTTKRRRGLFG